MNFWWTSRDKSKWDEEDWEAYDRYRQNVRESFLEANLQTVAFNEEIYERVEDGTYRSIETGEDRYLTALDDIQYEIAETGERRPK